MDAVRELSASIMTLVLEMLGHSSERSPLPKHEGTGSYTPLPEMGKTRDELLRNIELVVQESMNPLHPTYIGHMDSIPTLISVLGEWISSSINNNMLSLEMAPAFSRMETEVIRSLAKRFGYDDQAGGVMVSGGSLANIQALIVARNHFFNTKDEGLTHLNQKPVVLASEAAHTSIQKAMMVSGLGASQVISVNLDHHGRMDVQDLEQKVKEEKSKGRVPFAVIATAGTTVTGSIDPLQDIANVAKKYGLWLHADAAYGGALIFSDQYRSRIAGIEHADSITFNPQKWMYVAKTCAMVLFQKRESLIQNFRTSAPYMNESDFINLGEISIQGTRHAEIFKLWLSLQHIGLRGYEQLIHHGYELTAHFTNEVKKRNYLEVACEPDVNICCFRYKPDQVPEEQLDQLNQSLQQTLLNDAQTFLSFPVFRGQRWLRAVLLNPFTTEEHIQEIFRQIDQFHDEIYRNINRTV